MNAVISTNERAWILTNHVTFKLHYNQIYEMKTTNKPQKFILGFHKVQGSYESIESLEGKITRSKKKRQKISWNWDDYENIFGGSTNLSRSVSVHSSQSGWSTSPLLEIMSNNSAVFFNLLPKETFWPASPTKVNPWLLFWAVFKILKISKWNSIVFPFPKKETKAIFSLCLCL